MTTVGDIQLITCEVRHRSLPTAEAHTRRRKWKGNFVVWQDPKGRPVAYECIVFQDDAAMAQSLVAGRIVTAEER